jgi:hypothetical protein
MGEGGGGTSRNTTLAKHWMCSLARAQCTPLSLSSIIAFLRRVLDRAPVKVYVRRGLLLRLANHLQFKRNRCK